MSGTDDRHLLTDSKLLDSMESCIRIRNHAAFDMLEDVLWQRYVKFDMETIDVPFDRDKLVEEFFPQAIRDRYREIRSRMYPDLREQ